MEEKLLLTGFEPFGGDKINPSGEVAKSLDGAEIGGYQVVSRVLPVEWGTARDLMERFIDEVDPLIILSVGLSAGRAEISVEKVAINYAGKGKDNRGNVSEQNYIIENGPAAYFATIPAEEVVEELNKKGIPARLSLTAGAYLCNYVFYSACHYVNSRGKRALVGFIHVPALPEMVAGKGQSVPSMHVDLIRNAVISALETGIRSLTNCG